jgi:helicase MOV-10
MKFNVRFTFNRLPLKLQHRSTQLALEENLKRQLYPEPDTVCKWGNIIDPGQQLRLVDSFYVTVVMSVPKIMRYWQKLGPDR